MDRWIVGILQNQKVDYTVNYEVRGNSQNKAYRYIYTYVHFALNSPSFDGCV